MQKIVSNNYFFLIIIFAAYFISCSSDRQINTDSQKNGTQTDSLALKKEKWQIQKQQKIDLYQRIKIPKYWQSKTDQHKSIQISIATDFNVYLTLQGKNSYFFTVKDLTETKDSLIFITVLSKSKPDSFINWSFKYDTFKKTATWNSFNVQSGKFIKTGSYITVKD